MQRKSTDRARQTGDMARSFGYRDLDGQDKQPLVNSVFDRVADRYDLMNDLMSGGMHRLWKEAMVARLAPPRNTGFPWHAVDVAGGTGDIALRIARASAPDGRVTVIDINPAMLDVGRRRAAQSPHGAQIDFVEGNAEELAIPDGQFDAYTIAFGIRNVPRLDLALKEARRVLKHGGQFLCLEFSRVTAPVLDRLYDEWSMRAIPRIGKWVAGDDEPYRYLVESIRRFPDQKRFCGFLEEAGFERVGYRDLTGGIAALHWGWKL